jgi:hypothetical protein
MIVDLDKLQNLLKKPEILDGAGVLRREGNIFILGGSLPVRETLETLFDSHCQSPAELFKLTFGDLDHFHQGEQIARQIKRNFSATIFLWVTGLLPMGTPATAIAYASGFLKSRDIIVSGSVIMAISWLLFLLSVVFVWPHLGLRI